MFQNKTAWFSDSCLGSAKDCWVENGGKLEDVSLAQYVFSDNWEHDDTKVIYNSDAYQKQHLAVFNSQYVIDASHQGIDSVSLGKYFLIPPSIKESINTRRVQTTEIGHKSNNVCASTKSTQQTPLKNSRVQTITEIGHQRNNVCASSKSTQQIPVKTRYSTRQQGGDSSSSTSTLSSSSSLEVSSPQNLQPFLQPVAGHETKKLPTSHIKTTSMTSTKLIKKSGQNGSNSRENNIIDIDAIPHIKTLPKVTSCLRTIYPGKDGIKVKYVT